MDHTIDRLTMGTGRCTARCWRQVAAGCHQLWRRCSSAGHRQWQASEWGRAVDWLLLLVPLLFVALAGPIASAAGRPSSALLSPFPLPAACPPARPAAPAASCRPQCVCARGCACVCVFACVRAPRRVFVAGAHHAPAAFGGGGRAAQQERQRLLRCLRGVPRFVFFAPVRQTREPDEPWRWWLSCVRVCAVFKMSATHPASQPAAPC